MLADWDSLRREARQLESNLEDTLQAYSKVNSKLTNVNGEESESLLNADEESELALKIEKMLQQLSDLNDRMHRAASSSTNRSHSAFVQRYREVFFDYTQEYRKMSVSIKQKRDSQLLFRRNREHRIGVGDSATDHLIRERNAIQGSTRMADEILGQAMASKQAINQQGTVLLGARGRLGGLASNFPIINEFIGKIQKKRYRDNMIVAIVIGLCISFTIWFTFL